MKLLNKVTFDQVLAAATNTYIVLADDLIKS